MGTGDAMIPGPDRLHGTPSQTAGPYVHIGLRLVTRGINSGLATRMYFADEAALNGVAVYVFDVRLQGEGETVFFDI